MRGGNDEGLLNQAGAQMLGAGRWSTIMTTDRRRGTRPTSARHPGASSARLLIEKVGDGGAEALRDWRELQEICNVRLAELGVKRLLRNCVSCQ